MKEFLRRVKKAWACLIGRSGNLEFHEYSVGMFFNKRDVFSRELYDRKLELAVQTLAQHMLREGRFRVEAVPFNELMPLTSSYKVSISALVE